MYLRTRITLVLLAASVASLLAGGLALAAEELQDEWHYTLEKPATGWPSQGFDDSDWDEGRGGFGTSNTPGARIGTSWKSSDIWLRKSFKLQEVPERAALMIHHDEDAQVFINGQRVASMSGWTTGYKIVPLDDKATESLRKGDNLLAVHCHQTDGGQFIDVHVVDADNPPPFPEAPLVLTDLITKWGEELTPENAWTEYPRPQMARSDWQNLNGHWDYAVTEDSEKSIPSEWEGKILVPFCLESKLGGVQRQLRASEALWYHRKVEAKKSDGQRTLLNFEAVDYLTEVFVNGKSVGEHKGGSTPFSFDVTEELKDGENEIVVRVEDETQAWQLHGKQVLEPSGIWYTRVSGIWQTVWMEQVPSSYLEDLTIHTAAEGGVIELTADVESKESGQKVRLRVSQDGKQVAETTEAAGEELRVEVSDAKLWSPESPNLYDLEVVLLDKEGKQIDRVESYAGIRTVGKTREDDGHWRMTLNGEVVFHLGPLDQGWWPDGLLTPPSDESMVFEIDYLKSAGFNMLRKHIKVEPRRYYYHCDRLGILVWQDQLNGSKSPPWTHLDRDPEDAEWPDEHHDQFMLEFERMIDTLESHPSIVVWVPFNEAWGQHRTVSTGEWTSERDPSRLVNVASGGNFWPAGDIVDQHSYPHPSFPFDEERYADYIKVVGEFGGHGYPVEGHLWDAKRDNWGYGGLPKTKEEYLDRYRVSLEKLGELKLQGIAGGVYTQTTDVEGEINGLMTYDRKVIKIPAEDLKELHKQFYAK